MPHNGCLLCTGVLDRLTGAHLGLDCHADHASCSALYLACESGVAGNMDPDREGAWRSVVWIESESGFGKWVGAHPAASFLLPVGIKDNEGGVAVSIVSRGAGYWLWLASMICGFVSAMLLPVQASAARQAFSNRGTQRDFGDGNRP